MATRLMMMTMSVLCLFVWGCAGLNFSQMEPGAEGFHPTTIVVLPVIVGGWEQARGIIDNSLAKALVETGWFDKVIEPETMKNKLTNSSDLSGEVGRYMMNLNTVGLSDEKLAKKIGDSYGVEAILCASVSSWGYGRLEGKKLAKAGLVLKLIDVQNGSIVWRASHERLEDYVFFKADMNKLSTELSSFMIREMPH